MEELLMTHFVNHYVIPIPDVSDFILSAEEAYFEIEDAGALIIHYNESQGMARFSNIDRLECTIANYEKFLTALPNAFQRGKGRCDLLMLCNTNRYFILGEIKDSPRIKHYRKEAKKQLISSLTTLLNVPEILTLSTSKEVKRCCYFNKQSKSPDELNVTEAFNRINDIDNEGLKMQNAEIENFGFEFWEYTGNQTFTLTR